MRCTIKINYNLFNCLLQLPSCKYIVNSGVWTDLHTGTHTVPISWTKVLTSKVMSSAVWSLTGDSYVTIYTFIHIHNLYTLHNSSHAYRV